MNKKQAIALAKRISLEEGCVQHVNIRPKSRSFKDDGPVDWEYYVSDWYNSDSTVASFENGLQL